jgi:hypothetical protein
MPKAKKYSYSIRGVKIPEGEWLTLLEGAAYARINYARFTVLVGSGEIPSYVEPGKTRKRVRKSDIDTWWTTHRVAGQGD